MKQQLICLFLFFAFLFIPVNVIKGQITDIAKQKGLKGEIEFDVAPGKLFLTNSFLKGNNEKGRKIDDCLSIYLKYGFRFNDDSYLGKIYPETYQGLGVSFNTFFDYHEIGNPIAIYLYQGSPVFRFSSNLSLGYEWNFGVSFGWKSYDENLNTYNKVVGSKVNAYMNLGLILNWKINNKFSLTPGITVSHYSNGNSYHPNKGINDIKLRIGAVYRFKADTDNSNHKLFAEDDDESSPISYDLILYGSVRSKTLLSESYLVPGKFGIAGINFNPLYRLNRYFKAGVSLDCQYDESANIKIIRTNDDEGSKLSLSYPSFWSKVGLGLSLRGEFAMPIFSINIGLGHNFLYKGSDLNGFYQILVLKTFITDKLFLHTGYQLVNFKKPKNLMFGLGYRF